MGKKGREILKLDIEELIETLNRVYADEWLSVYNYLLAAHLAAGINAPAVASVLKKNSEQELTHANKIAERIIQLGGEPVRSISKLETTANCPDFKMPQDPTDLEGILRAVLEAERCAIQVYQDLVDNTRVRDPVTHEMAEELLADEVADEEEIENLLGE